MLAFLILSGSPLAANGVQESRMVQARQLIAEKNYNDALTILITVVREEPDRQDEAQDLINMIMALRNQYNSNYEKVIDLLYVQKDEVKALALIKQINELDKNPNKQMADDVKQMQRSARLIANNKRYNDIMARALALLNRKEYGQAVQVYLEGSDLAKDMFVEEAYGNVLTNQVDRAWEDLKSASALFVQAESRLKTLPDQGTILLASAGGTVTSLEPVLAPMRDLATWRQRAWADGVLFRNQGQFLVKNGRQVDFYLDYSHRFINGPPDSGTSEGILGAIDRLWAEVLEPWTARVRSEVESQYSQAKLALEQGRYPAAKAAFEGLRVKARQGLDVVTLWNRIAGVDGGGALDPAYRNRLTQVLPLGIWLQRRLVLADQGIRAATDLPRAAAFVATADLDRPSLEGARADVKAQRINYASFGQSIDLWTRETQALGAQGFTLLDPPAFTATWQASWAGFRQRAQAQEALFVDRRGNLDYSLLDNRYQGLQVALNGARDQVEGPIRYPLQATARLTELRPGQDVLAQDIGAFVSLYDGEIPEVKTPAVQQWPVKGRELLGRLRSAQTLQGQLLATAQANYAQSQTLKKQGQAMVPQVTVATSAENFTKARADLNALSTRFSESLKLQEDPAFRSESDALVNGLFAEITKAENEVVVREVRKLITQGSEAYLAQQFRSSEQLLLKAQKRWADTNKDPNSEVEYWLNLTSYALSVTTGREISPLDPLYNEVQTLLNFARRDFTLGKDKLALATQEQLSEQTEAASTHRQEGLALMGQATSTLGKILLTQPQNQEAGLLKLEILKASDPENFPALYKQNFDIAVAKITGGNPQVAYTDLQDLDKIQPGYPGMASAIKAVRLKLGLDKAAVDPKDVAEARALVSQATKLFEGGSPAQLADARARVQRALALDAKNTAAQDLIDKISLKITNFVATLTPTQVGELNDMLELLRNQRTLEALAKITEFKAKNPAVANDARVKEVERRIKAVN